MNYLVYDINNIQNHINHILRDYNYTFLNFLKEEYEIQLIYDYLQSIEEYKLKNIWNSLVKKWNDMNKQLKDNQKYKKSNYSKININYYHNLINDDLLNEKLISFIKNDKCKGIFIINIILKLIV